MIRRINKGTTRSPAGGGPKAEPQLGLRPLEPQTSRVVLVHGPKGEPVGAGCLVSDARVLTCLHVVRLAIAGKAPERGDRVRLTLVGVTNEPVMTATVLDLREMRNKSDFPSDLALLGLDEQDSRRLSIEPVEFASPLRYSGKEFGVMGFPKGMDFGAHSEGILRAPDRAGLVQMDGISDVAATQGFSGAPVWCASLQAFVGILVATEDDAAKAWCISSRLLAQFFPDLPVRFRIPPGDRPIINDREVDDPNLVMFGRVANDGRRSLFCRYEWKGKRSLRVHLEYRCLPGSEPPRGGFVTFITYPDFGNDDEDSYELFTKIEEGVAANYIEPNRCFTVAAIGDAGDTVLTLNLCDVEGGPDWFY